MNDGLLVWTLKYGLMLGLAYVSIYYGWNMSLPHLWSSIPAVDNRAAFGLALLLMVPRACLTDVFYFRSGNVNVSVHDRPDDDKSSV